MTDFIRLYHGTTLDNALEIMQRGLLARAYLPRNRLMEFNPSYYLNNNYPEHQVVWLLTNKKAAVGYGSAVVEFHIPREFTTTSMTTKKPVYIDQDTATVRGGGIPAKYVAGYWFEGEFEAKR